MAQPQLVYSQENNVEVSTIATAAVLIDMNISTWTGRKRDKQTTDEVNVNKQTGSNKAASVIKNLMSDDTDLDRIRAYAQDTRLFLMKHTFAWGDGGTRLLPSALIFDVTSQLDGRIQQFDMLVNAFCNNYGLKVSAAAFKLGQLFNRAEFPDTETVRRKFNVRYVLHPVPTSGDFRVDVQKDVGEYLKKQFETAANDRVTAMLREPWQRIYENLTHVKERMEAALAFEPAGEGEDKRRAPKIYQTVIDNAIDLAGLLDKLNISKDPALDECVASMRRLFVNLDIKSVRESKEVQASVKTKIDDILGKFDFGGFNLE